MGVPAPGEVTIRVRRAYVLFCICLLVLGCRSAWIMVARRADYLRYDILTGGTSRRVKAPAGTIYDRHGEPLARTIEMFAIWADPTLIVDAAERLRIVEALYAQRGLSEMETFRRLGRDTEFVYLEHCVPRSEADRVRRLKLPGVFVSRELRRDYPRGVLCAHVLGWRRRDDHIAAAGLERRWHSLLDGRDGFTARNVDSGGRTVIGAERAPGLDAEPGKSLVLTIDAGVQAAAEEALDGIMAEYQPALGCTATVLEVKTGAILAMACRPAFDPNTYYEASPEEHFNVCVGRAFEPGSVLKLILAAAALETGVVAPSARFHCGGHIVVAGRERRCWGRYAAAGHGPLDLEGILVNSCNVGAIRVGQRMGRERYLPIMRAFQFGERLGSGLAAEVAGYVPSDKEVNSAELASLSFGYNIMVTDLHMAAAVAALANEGVMMRPHIVREALTADNETFYKAEPEELSRPVSPGTARAVLQMMGKVVEGGTGRRAAIEGVRVGGKTGTALKLVTGPDGNKRFSNEQTIVSFVAVAPLDDPQVVIYVTADEPPEDSYGGLVGAPAAREIAMHILRKRGLLPVAYGVGDGAREGDHAG